MLCLSISNIRSKDGCPQNMPTGSLCVCRLPCVQPCCKDGRFRYKRAGGGRRGRGVDLTSAALHSIYLSAALADSATGTAHGHDTTTCVTIVSKRRLHEPMISAGVCNALTLLQCQTRVISCQQGYKRGYSWGKRGVERGLPCHVNLVLEEDVVKSCLQVLLVLNVSLVVGSVHLQVHVMY